MVKMQDGVRARARRQLVEDIIRIAEGQLAERGTAGISLRAVARELGMVSSAIYRYFPTGDALLTELIIRAYTDQADAAEAALRRAPEGPLEQFLAVAHACRQWALANPHRYALIYGSPVPDYAAPATTVEPAARVGQLLLGVLAAAPEPQAGGDAEAALEVGSSPEAERAFAGLARNLGSETAPGRLALGVAAWSHIYGMISFELFGHFRNSVTDNAVYFDAVMRHWCRQLGLGEERAVPS